MIFLFGERSHRVGNDRREMEAKNDNLCTAEEWCREGQRLAEDGNYVEALRLYTLAIEQDNRFADAFFGRGACYYSLGKYERSKEDLNAAALLGSRVAQIWSKFKLKPPPEVDAEDA